MNLARLALRSASLAAAALLVTGCGEIVVERREPPAKPEPEPSHQGDYVQIAAATDRTCAVDVHGAVLCWGLDLLSATWGDLHAKPTLVAGVAGATRVELTETYACALTSPAGLVCWGALPWSEVGAAPTGPTLLAGSDATHDFAVTGGRICAALESGAVRCWGTLGDLGACFATGVATAEPFDLPGVSDATTVAASGSATCFTRSQGAPACWLGGDTTQLFELDFADARSLAISESDGCFSAHATYCAVRESGAVECFQGFDSATLEGPIPIYEGSPKATRAVWTDLSDAGSCVLTETDELRCAGAPGGPVLSATDVAMASTHACALVDGVVSCWGSNEAGALGVDVPARRGAALPVADLHDAVALDAGFEHTCATRATGDVVCWGSNMTAQRGWSSSPIDATFHPRWAWSADELSELPRAVASVPGASSVFADQRRTCATLASGPVVCWGQDLTARLSLAVPTEIDGVTAATSVSAGDDSESCAVVAGGAVECWGRGWFGSRVGKETLALPGPAQQVDGDTYEACARLDSGDVYCWGGHVEGSIGGDGDPLAPKKRAGVGDAIDLSKGCVVTGAHELLCWAFPWQPDLVVDGQPTVLATGVRDVDGPCIVRDGGTVECFVDFASLDPLTAQGFAPVPSVTNAVSVATGANHACALLQDGGVACWGWAAAGRLGDGSRTVFAHPTPVAD